jgi:hypothetical protein
MEIPSILDTAKYRHLVLDGVNSIETSLAGLQGFQIPEYDEINIDYYGSTNNISTVQYLNSGTLVATLTFVYATQPPTVNDTNLVNVAISFP